MNDDITIRQVLASAHPEDVFGLPAKGATREEALTFIRDGFKAMVKLIHPDVCKKPQAIEAFKRLGELRGLAERKVTQGHYGDRSAPVLPAAVNFASKRFGYTLAYPLARGDLSVLYHASREPPNAADPLDHTHVAVKISEHPSTNDLLEHEHNVLATLFPEGQAQVQFYRYLPRHDDAFIIKDDGGAHRRANVFEELDHLFSLEEVKKAYPKGLDSRDVVWMFKRALAGLGFVHAKGWVHGAITPAHVMVDPIGHGAKLVDWCYAVRTGERVRAASRPYRYLYAPEILDKKEATPATDIYMLGMATRELLGPNPPEFFRRFLDGLTIKAQKSRPDDAWKLHEEFDQLLLNNVGKPKYRKLEMPARTR